MAYRAITLAKEEAEKRTQTLRNVSKMKKFNVLEFQEELTTLKTPSHPDEFGYTVEGYEEWMRKNNPAYAVPEEFSDDPVKMKRQFLRPYLNDPIVVDVLERIKRRADEGMEKYGVPMTREDIDTVGWLRHAQEEALDLAIYLERIIRDLQKKT